MASPRQISSSFIFHEDHFPFLQRRRKGLVTRELKFEGEERRRRKRIFDDFFFTGDDGRDPWPMRGGREFKSGSYFRSHRDDNAISAFTRKDLSWRVRHCAFRPDVSVVVKLPPPPHPPLPNRFSFAPLFPDIALRLNGTGETLLSLVPPPSSNRIIRKMAENIAKYSRSIV